MPNIGVLILTYNEELNIGDCIESASFADEIVVIDSGSTDQTVDIAQKLGVKVIIHPMTEGFAAQRNFAVTQTEAEWVMFLDADERIVPELVLAINMATAKNEHFVYMMPRRNIVFGQWLRYGNWYPDYVLRLYPRVAGCWRGLVHEVLETSLPKKKLGGYLIHYTYSDWNQYFNKVNNYTMLMAKKMNSAGKKANMVDITLRPLWAFFQVYLLRGGWLDGRLGFIMAVFHAYYTMVKYVKLYYLQRVF